ncbi:hypothetical protein BGZ98_007535 [Dissophora globulifera]|nr:hypothetical protein BGZ98_007535 [Dissophora globulifera]
MSLDTDIRRDANLTPTRFLLECGAFTPGFGLGFDNYNPFDTSLKSFNTGTPKVELNPFESSFKTPSYAVSLVNDSKSSSGYNTNSSSTQESEQKRGTQHDPWALAMFDETAMSMPQVSPGLSLSSVSSTVSPSPPLRSPPPQTATLSLFYPSMAIDPNATQTRASSEDRLVFESNTPPRRMRHSEPNLAQFSRDVSDSLICGTLAPSETLTKSIHQVDHYQFDEGHNDEDNEDDDDDEVIERDDYRDYDQELIDRHDDCGIDTAMSVLDMRRSSTGSDIHSSPTSSAMDCDSDADSSKAKATKSRKSSRSRKGAQATAASASARKSKCATKSTSRKRSSSEEEGEETPELKRQKFLERNRMAASKCREKKRLQTLKTISDADMITARNQELHETLGKLQEEAEAEDEQISSNNVKAETTDKGNETEPETDPEEFDSDIIDHTTFDQLLEMDDEEDHEFSKSLVWNYFEQAEKTFAEMDEAMENVDLPNLSRLGHFLKGSSAALGLTKVKESCEKLQHYGNCMDAKGEAKITNDEAKTLIKLLLVEMRKEYDEARDYLEQFYEEQQP